MKSRHFLLLASSALLAISAIQTPAHARADHGFVVAQNDKDNDKDAQKKKQNDRRPDKKQQQQKANEQRQQQQKKQADDRRQQLQKANEQRQQQQKKQADERRQQLQKANEQRQQQQKKQADERRQQLQKVQERSAQQRQATPQRDQKDSDKRDERAKPDQRPAAQNRPERKDEPKSLAPAATKKDDNAPAARKQDADKKQDAEKRDAVRKLDEQRKNDADKKLDEQKKRDAVQKLDEQKKRDAVRKFDEQRNRDSDRRRDADRDRDSDRKRDADRDRDSDRKRDTDRDRDSDRRRDADRNQRDDRSRGAIAPAALPTKPQSAAEFIRRKGEKPTVTIDEVRKSRRETREGDRVVIREGDRTIIKNDNRTIIQHVEAQRFAVGARDVNVNRRGNETVTVFERPNGVRIVNVTDRDGRLIRRVRRDRGGREFVIIDNSWHRRHRPDVEVFVDLPPVRIRDRAHYFIDAGRASPAEIYQVFTAPPVVQVDERYTVDQVRYSYPLRERMPRVDLDVHFETGSWQLTPDQVARLQVIADGLNRAIEKNPREVFLIEGHTDAVGAPEDNLSLSDRRAESVAVALTEQFQVPPENLVTQGYGEEHLKVETEGASRENRRVTVLRITPLINQAQN